MNKTELREPISISEVLCFIKSNPSTYEEISIGTGEPKKRIVRAIRRLKQEDKARNVVIDLGRNSQRRNPDSEKLVNSLGRKAIAYCPGDERLLGEKIAEYLPKEFDSIYMKRGLIQRLRRFLPREAYNIVHEYIIKAE
jgi:hypothetical protein